MIVTIDRLERMRCAWKRPSLDYVRGNISLGAKMNMSCWPCNGHLDVLLFGLEGISSSMMYGPYLSNKRVGQMSYYQFQLPKRSKLDTIWEQPEVVGLLPKLLLQMIYCSMLGNPLCSHATHLMVQ